MTYNIWEVNSDQTIYYWNGAAGWTQVPGSLVSIAAGGDGEVWGINSSHNVFRWNGTAWMPIPGALLHVAVGSGQVWGIDSLNNIGRWNGTEWMRIAGSLLSLAVGDDGQVWGVDGDHKIFQWNGSGWTQIPGSLVSVAVASDGHVWGTDEHHLIYHWTGTAWTQIPGNLDSIVAGGGMIWGLSGGQIYRQTMTGWVQIPGSSTLNVASLAVASPPAPVPTTFASNFNYLLYSDCNPVKDLAVTITVTHDMFTTGGVGFSVQLNAYSMPNHNYSYQQYCITVDGSPPEIGGAICNWSKDNTHFLIDQDVDLAPLPNGKLPSGWQFKINLTTDAPKGNVSAVTFKVVDATGTTRANKTMTLLSLKDIKGNSLIAADLAPITAFEVNIVGPDDGDATTFSSGSGTITYVATSPLTVINHAPACIESGTPGTAETSNCKYGFLPWTESKTLVQSFICGNAPPA